MTDEEAIQAAGVAQNPNIYQSVPPLPREAEAWFKNISPGMFQNYQQMQQTWNNPIVQFSVVLVRDPSFRDAVSEINHKFVRNTVLGYEIGWVLLIWTLRAWRLSKAGSWLSRIWTQAWVSVIFWWGGLFLVPWLLWGKSYQMMLATVFRALIHQFWA